MKIKILVDVVVSGKNTKKGEVVDASDRDAQYLLGIKKAVAYKEKKAEEKPKADPKPKKKEGKK